MGFVGAVSPSRLCVSSRAWPVGNAARLKSSSPPVKAESTAGQSELEPPSEDLVVRLDLDVLTLARSLDRTRSSLALRSFARLLVLRPGPAAGCGERGDWRRGRRRSSQCGT